MKTLSTPAQDLVSSANLTKTAKSNLTKLAGWISDRNIPFLVTSIGMIVMLLWAGSYKMTAPGAEGIVPWFPTARSLAGTLNYSALISAPI
jgi:hypothetical protein